MRRGDIYFADLSPVVGSEQGGVRPVVVIQNDVGNRHGSTTIVAPLTTRKKTHLPTHVEVTLDNVENTVLLEQIRSISRTRLVSHCGQMSARDMERIDEGLLVSVGLNTPQHNGKRGAVLMCGGCQSCPVREKGCSAPYRSSVCEALRAKAGVDYDPLTNGEILAMLLDGRDTTKLIDWLNQPVYGHNN